MHLPYVRRLSRHYPDGLLSWILLFAVLCMGFAWRLGTLTPGYNIKEILARESSASLSVVLHNPLNIWHLLLQLPLQQAGHYGPLAIRLSSVVFASLTLVSLAYLVRQLFSKRLSILISIIFATIPVVIIAAHSATPLLMLVASPLFVAAAGMYLSRSKWTILSVTLFSIALSCALTTPGVIWLLLIAVLIYGKRLLRLLRQDGPITAIIISTVLALTLLVLGLAFSKDSSLLRHWLLLPATFDGLAEIGASVAWAGLGLVLHTRDLQTMAIARLPLLDALAVVLLAFGLLYCLSSLGKKLSIMAVASIIIGCVISGINHDPELLLLALPGIILFITAGLATLLSEWFKIFPFNPIARYIALGAIALLIGAHVLYGYSYSLVAWPRSTATKQSFMIK